MALKLGLVMGIGTNTYTIDMDCVKEAENLGFDSIWTSEAWGSDAVTPAAWILAQTSKIKVGTGIIQMPARTPSCVAMTAMTLNALSGGRFILGLGPSGPQVVEGWYGVPYGRPITRLREYVEIIRKILEREGALTHEGYHYQIPLKGGKATGLGKPLKSILHGEPSLKIFSAAISPSGVKAAAELTDGFIPFFMDPNGFHVFLGSRAQLFLLTRGSLPNPRPASRNHAFPIGFHGFCMDSPWFPWFRLAAGAVLFL